MSTQDFSRGPFLVAALLCEKILVEQDDVCSLVRVVSVFTHTEGGTNPPRHLPPIEIKWAMLVEFARGEATGKYDAEIVHRDPQGRSEIVGRFDVRFDDKHTGHGTRIRPFTLATAVEGLHTFDVMLQGQLMTRVPLQIRYNRVVVPTMPPGSKGH